VGEVRARTGAPVFVCGFSAGGHLAATLGVHWKKLGLQRPDGLILCYPVITAVPELCNEESLHNLAGDGDRGFYSLEDHVSPDTPPAFLWHTAGDESVPVENSLRFASALSRAGVPFELHVYPFGAHGLSLATEEVAQPENRRVPDPHVAGWIRECGEWMDVMLNRRG
jgi:acetyl esterase/lipase